MVVKKVTWWGFEPGNFTTPHMSSDREAVYSVRITNYE
jgi:hypothetical protein